MSNSLLTPTIILRESLRLLDNNLVMGSLVNRAYEDEFTDQVKGNKVGETIQVRRPVRYTVRSGAVVQAQDTTEGKVSISVDTQEGVDLKFTSRDMTMTISMFSDRYLKPAMLQLANSVDVKLASLYRKVWNWVGTPGQTINSFADFALAPQRLDEMAVPADRSAILSPADTYGLLGSFTGLYLNDVAGNALKRAKLPMLAGIDPYSTQNVQTHVVGAAGGTPLVRGASQGTTYALVKDSMEQTLATDGWTGSSVLKAGDVFTIDGVYAVNPVTKAVLPYLQQFVVKADVTTAASSANETDLTISPPIITSGAYQTVSAAPADDAPITYKGTASTGYLQNMAFHKDAFALCMVPMEKPEGAVSVTRESYKGLSARLIPFYDGTNDVSYWRLDILYGVKAVYPDLATRISGTA